MAKKPVVDSYASSAPALYLNGTNFRISAQQLASSLELDSRGCPKKLTAIPMYYLASHAAEQFLKAALLKRGCTEQEIRKNDIRHDLKALLRLLAAKNIAVSQETQAIVIGLSEQHKKHQLRYSVLLDDGEKTYWPPVCMIFTALDELLLLCRISAQNR